MIPVKKIDIHAHLAAFPEFFPPNGNGTKTITPEQLLEIYDRLNIEKGILLPLAACEAMASPITSEGCAAIARQYPDRFLWFCGVDPRTGRNMANTDLSVYLNHYKSLGALGVGELTTQLPLDDPMMDNFFTHCAACKMPVLIHMATKHGGTYGVEDDLGLPRLEAVLKKHPDLVIIGHSQPFWTEISADVTQQTRGGSPKTKVCGEGRLYALLRSYPNLYCDISAGSGKNALCRDPENAVRFLEEFSDRILYGCDITTTECPYAFELDAFLTGLVEQGRLRPETYRKVVRENAIRLFGL